MLAPIYGLPGSAAYTPTRPLTQLLASSHFKLPQDVALHASAADGAQRLAPPQQQLCAGRTPAHDIAFDS